MGTNQQYSWAQWTAAGLDKHSVVADPLFTDVNKTWPNYLPKGDYTVKTGSPALALGFKNFPMDSFGVMGVPGLTCNTSVQYPNEPNGNTIVNNPAFDIKFNAGHLIVSHNEQYQLRITTSLGRTVKVFEGKGRFDFAMNAKSVGSGIYFVLVRSKNVSQTKRFIVN
jgi:hypothetical protein